MRSALLLLSLAACSATFSCTLFKVTGDGRTIVGNNEDAWSIDAQIRFENGNEGEFGAVYFGHFNGHPFSSMADQGGMNTAGLMYDGLMVEPKHVPPAIGRPSTDYEHLMHLVMRTCADVEQAKRLIATYNLSWLYHSMIVLVDSSGAFLVVESDSLYIVNDPSYAVGNFRPSACADLDAVPIARYQKGRALITSGGDGSLAYCTTVIDSMRACRDFLGNGTLYTDILELDKGIIHLYFYHDFTHQRTFNLKAELAKGDHAFEMASLFPPNAEYGKLLAYKTPFHNHGIFYTLMALAGLMVLTGLWSAFLFLRAAFRRTRGSFGAKNLWRPFAMALSSAIAVFLIAVLLINESVYYFGLGDAMDAIHPALKFLPLVFLTLIGTLLIFPLKGANGLRALRSGDRIVSAYAVLGVALVAAFGYWGLLVP